MRKNSQIRIGGYGNGAATFPLRLWKPAAAGWWWNQLNWTARVGSRVGDRSTAEVSWLELVVDVELATGCRCTNDVLQEASWGARARVLKSLIYKLLEVRGVTSTFLKTWYGENKPNGVAPWLRSGAG